MNSDLTTKTADAPTDTPESEATGLPGLRTWPMVYVLVTGVFVVVVGLLAVLSRMYS